MHAVWFKVIYSDQRSEFIAPEMSSPGRKPRPTDLLNLGSFAGDSGVASSPPVNVPRRSGQSSRPISSAPPARHVTIRSPVGYERDQRGVSASLIDPVMDEGDVLSTSVTSSNSSLMQKHRDAATWGAQSWGTGGGVGNGPGRDFTRSMSDDEYVKIQARNEAKRQDHATT